MKIIALTQRVDTHATYNEKRDALDKKWASVCHACNFLPIILPNYLPLVMQLLERIPLDGFIFTGGNTLSSNQGDTPERDAIEMKLIEYAMQKELPVMGVCRGMQIIQHFFSIPLFKIEGHVKKQHAILFNNKKRIVNSYHEYGTSETVPQLVVKARTEDGVIEAIQHQQHSIQGIMWHPERNPVLDPQDKALFIKAFK